MENQKQKINVTFGENEQVKELVIRNVDSVNELPVMKPIQFERIGCMGSIVEFLSKRNRLLNSEKCHINVKREARAIELVFNEDDHYTKGYVGDVLEIHPKFKEFGINTGKNWTPNELGQYFKMNRFYFADRSENMALVTTLKNFMAKVNVAIDKQKDDNGSFADNYNGVVTSNLPANFKINIPIFKGQPKEVFEVEFMASVSGREVHLQMYSPGAVNAMDEITDSIIDEQLEKIRAINDLIPIIEQ